MDADLREVVARWLPGVRVDSVEPLTGGDVNAVYRVDAGAGTYALRVYAAETSAEMVMWEHTLLGRISGVVPEVVAPLMTSDGATFVERDARAVSLWPFVEGRRLDRLIGDDRLAAARMLGRLHAALGDLDGIEARPGYLRWADVDWREHRLWSWSRADRAEIGARVDLGGFERELEDLPAAVRELDASALPLRAIHGDYYSDNLLLADGEVSAVLDWDECRVDWRAWEIAGAVWSFCRDESRVAVDSTMAAAFLEEYERAGGVATAAERATFELLMRAARLWEALYVLGEIQRGVGADWEYFEMNVLAMDRLRGLEIG